MKFFNKKDKKKTIEIGYEESERKTPVLGYVLLITMAIVVFVMGSSVLTDLDNVVKKPEKLSSCSSEYLNYDHLGYFGKSRYYTKNYSYYNPQYGLSSEGKCNFSEIEKKYSIDTIYFKGQSLRSELSELRKDLGSKEGELSMLKVDYQLSLTENISKTEKTIYSSEKLASKINALESDIKKLKEAINKKEKELGPYKEELKVAYNLLKSDLDSQWRWHDFYVFLLQVLFIFPLFFFLLRKYFQLSTKNSPYTIIFTFLLIPISIFIIKIVFVYFWTLFLASLLEYIWSIIKNIELLKSFISYLGMILVAFVFGGAVYLLQKKIFNPERLFKRHLRDNKCPHCSFSLKLSGDFCSNCGAKILVRCENCGNDKFKDLSFCRYCGYNSK